MSGGIAPHGASPTDLWTIVTGISAAVSAAGSAVVAVAAWVGFRAISISQKSLDVSKEALAHSKASLADERKHRSVVAAIEQNDRFNRELRPEFRNIWDAYMLERESSMLAPGNSFKVSSNLAARAKLHGASLESWALFVLYEVAEEELLREVSGPEFCHQVRRLALLANISTAEATVDWRSAYKLADQWEPSLPNKLQEVARVWRANVNKQLGEETSEGRDSTAISRPSDDRA